MSVSSIETITPSNNIRKDDFKVLEDNVPQPIFSFTEEEVPVIYGLAVDTSGSLRPQLSRLLMRQSRSSTAIRKATKLFSSAFIAADKIETIQDFYRQQRHLDGWVGPTLHRRRTDRRNRWRLSRRSTRCRLQKRKATTIDAPRLIVVTDGEDAASYYSERQLPESCVKRRADLRDWF